MRRLQRRFRKLRVESLEDRRMLVVDPTAQEQEMLEDVNRMRMFPQNELNVLFTNVNTLTSSDSGVTQAVQSYGVSSSQLQSDFAALTAVAPLAWSDPLSTAAQNHSAAMIAANTQSHQVAGEQDIVGRANSAGYTTYSYLGENIFAYSNNVFYGHAAFAIDWGNSTPGHRNNIMSGNFQEVGIDVTATGGSYPNVGPLVITQDFGNRFDYGNPQLLGVVYVDSNGNSRYDAGEGRSSVTITATPVGGGAPYIITTMTAGGYQMHVPSGTYNVVASGGGLGSPLTFSNVVVGSVNRKVDFNVSVPPNAAPVNTVPGAQSIATNGTLVFSSGGGNAISVADADAGSNPMRVTLSVTAGSLSLGSLSGLAFAAGDGALDSTMTFVATATNINTALAGLQYFAPGSTSTVTLTITTNDQGYTGSGGAQIDTDTVTINVAPPANIAPVNNVPVTQATRPNVPFQFNAANGNSLSISDADAGGNSVRVTLLAGSGNFTLGQISGLSFISGDGTNDTTMTFTGTIANINAALNNSYFTPNGGFSGNASLTITTNDLGNTGAGGALTDSDTVSIQVMNAVVVTGNTVTLTGTVGVDNLSVVFSSATNFSVTLNGVTSSYSTAAVNAVRFALGGGNDTFNATLSPNSDTIVIGPERFDDTGSGYTVFGSGGNTQVVYANGSGGTAQFLDSSGNDVFYGLGTNNYMSGPGFFNQVVNLTTVYAYSTGGADIGVLYDSAGNDNYYGLANSSIMAGGGQFAQTVNFRYVYAFATNGGTDVAQIYDATTADTFYSFPTYGLILCPNYFAQASGFEGLYGIATSGGTDVAVMYDSAGADTFTATSDLSILVGTGYSDVAYLFEYVYAYGSSGGTNVANLSDSAGSDYLLASGNQLTLYYPTSTVYVVQFTNITATSSHGGTDQRHLLARDYALSTVGAWVTV